MVSSALMRPGNSIFHSIHRLRAWLAVALILGGALFVLRMCRQESPVTGSPAVPGPARPDPARVTPLAATGFRSFDRGRRREFRLALDEAVVRLPEGTDRIIPLVPPATKETLPARLAAIAEDGPVFPLCREAVEDGSPSAPGIVTEEILLKLTGPDTAAPGMPPGIAFIDRPAYARDYLRVAAADPFAALAAAPALGNLPGVESADVQIAKWLQPRAMPADPLVPQQWHLKYQGQSGAIAGTDLNIESAWNFGGSGGMRGTGIRVGVVDDGLETAHPDLAANVDLLHGKDWNGGDDDPNPTGSNNHGTACAGDVAARAENGIGGCGTAPEATLVGMRLIAAAVTDAQQAEVFDYLSTGPAQLHIKSNSWGPTDDAKTLEAPGPLALAALESAATLGRDGLGTIFTWAAGNGGNVGDNSNYDGYANSIHAIAIGAYDSQGRQSYYSEPGANLVVVAPSNGSSPALGITTTDRTGAVGYTSGDYYTAFGGTSSATPTAAGVIALMLQKNPRLGGRDVKEILMRSADKFVPADGGWSNNSAGLHFNPKFGAGKLNATAAVDLSAHWFNLPPATRIASAITGISDAIPDNNPTGVTRTFTFSGPSLRVEHVTVTLDVTHTYRGDLRITLTSPSGMTSLLADSHSDPGNDFDSWTFSSVRHWGEFSTGTWTLQVSDIAAIDLGTLDAATLTLHGTPVGYAAWIASYPALTGYAANDDPDHDGTPNLLEYYFGGRPDRSDTGLMPACTRGAGNVELDWWHPSLPTGVTATPEWSDTLAGGSWSSSGFTQQTLADNGNGRRLRASLPTGAGVAHRFLRLRVDAP